MNTNQISSLELLQVTNLENLTSTELGSAISTYRQAFAQPPYNEEFSDAEAQEALQYILDSNGDLVMGRSGDEMVSIAGGFLKPDNSYYIEELAVNPEYQGQGLGRLTLDRLIEKAYLREPTELQIRTTIQNNRAIQLYTSEGFRAQPSSEIVAQTRQSGAIGLDERIYLNKPSEETEMEPADKLKRVAIAYPSGNTTAVIFDQRLNDNRQRLNNSIMESWKNSNSDQPEIEQCCFVTLPESEEAVARVEMLGGEFCGNATRSAIELITKGQDYQGKIEVSGVDRALNFNVKDQNISLEMPLPENGSLVTIVEEGTLVQLDGIAQLVVDTPKNTAGSPRELLEELLAENKYNLASQPAVGVCFYDKLSEQAQFAVWVKEVATIFDETACGSGTCAIVVAETNNTKQNTRLNVIQPSGETITTEAVYDQEENQVTAANISGQVGVLYDGELEIQ